MTSSDILLRNICKSFSSLSLLWNYWFIINVWNGLISVCRLLWNSNWEILMAGRLPEYLQMLYLRKIWHFGSNDIFFWNLYNVESCISVYRRNIWRNCLPNHIIKSFEKYKTKDGNTKTAVFDSIVRCDFYPNYLRCGTTSIQLARPNQKNSYLN